MAKDDRSVLRMEDTAASSSRGQLPPSPWRRGRTWRLVVAIVSCYLLVVALLAPFTYFNPYRVQVGEIYRDDVYAPIDFEIVDRTAVAQRSQYLEDHRPHVWIQHYSVESEALQKLNGVIDLIQERSPQSLSEVRELSQTLIDQYDLAIDPATLSQFVPRRLHQTEPPVTLNQMREQLALVIRSVLNDQHIVSNKATYQAHAAQDAVKMFDERGGVVTDPPDPQQVLDWSGNEVRPFLTRRMLPNYLPGEGRAELREAAAELTVQLIGQPNITYNSERSLDQYHRAMRQLRNNPPTEQFARGDLIVKAGERLNPLQADALAYLNSVRQTSTTWKLVGLMIITAAVFLAMGIYMIRFQTDLPTNEASTVLLMAMPVLVALLVGQSVRFLTEDPSNVMLWFPAAMVGMLSTLLLSPRVAFMLVLAVSCLFGFVSEKDLTFLLYALAGGFAAVLACRQVRARGEVMRVGLLVGLVNIATILIITFMRGDWRADPIDLGFAFFNGMACAAGTLILLVISERTFDITTDLRLLELTGLRHPLLRQLEEKAPGSYQHVLNVTKLAEAAAVAIGANYLLVRAGALFHDIGKMVKPKYFSENQVTLEDKKAHGKLSPYMSVLIIKNHVKEGIELARRARPPLPQKIVDFIPQHHGTGLIRYFYSTALKRYEESEAMEPVRENDFRYPGPRPQSVEAAIVLLADSVEAIAASKFVGGQVNEDEIRRMTQMAVTERFNDGQFDECDLTFKQLDKIREAFVRTLMARYHFRVAYPDLPKRPESRDAAA